MKLNSIKTILSIISILLGIPTLVEATGGINIQKQSLNHDTISTPEIETEYASDYPLFSAEYVLSTPINPSSKKYDLNGISTMYSFFRAETNYGWYLDKKKEKSVLLASLGYSYLKANTFFLTNDEEKDRVESEVPKYIYSIPNIHEMNLNLIFNQKLKRNWEISGSYNIVLASDLSHGINNKDYNSTGFIYLQKSIRRFNIGAGYASYLIGNKVTGIPLGYVSFSTNKFKVEALAPVSLDCFYKLSDKTMLKLNGNLDFGGYVIYYDQQSFVNSDPDYVETTDVNFSLSIDKRFYKKLHWSLGLGLFNRELSYLADDVSVETVSYNEGLFLSAKIYCTF